LSELSKQTALEWPEGNPLFESFDGVRAPFDFARVVVPLDAQEGTPLLDEYFDLIAGAAQALSGAPGKKKEGDKKPDGPPGLDSMLSPVGQLAYAIHFEADDSLARAVEEWLLTADIPSDVDGPFVTAHQLIYSQGLREVETKVAKAWEDLEASHIAPLRNVYPFRKGATESVSLKALENAFHPEGAFWSGVGGLFGQVLVEKRGQWRLRPSNYGDVELPTGMIATLNWAGRMRNLLWDTKGDKKPLVVGVRPDGLPRDVFAGHLVVMTYLKVADDSAFGLNLRPDFQRVSLPWWEPTTAAVGAGFSVDGVGPKVFREYSIPDTEWSLFRLLDTAAEAPRKGSGWSWLVGSPVLGNSLRLSFFLESDPRAIFRRSAEEDITSL
jgi:hypothetical protein